MERTRTLLLSFTFAVASAQAQPVLLETDLVSNTAMSLFHLTGTSNAATNGANVTWNLGTDTFTPFGSAVFTTPSNTPYAGQYPTANWAIAYNATGIGAVYSIYRSTNLLLEQLADGLNSTNEEIYTNARQLLRFPFSYQTNFTDTYQVQGGTSETEIWTYSGYGTLITPNGTFTNVVKISSNTGFTVFWLKSPLIPLIQLDDTNAGLVLLPSAVSVSEPPTPLRLAAFPNPATSTLQLSGCQAGDRYVVSDAAGRWMGDGLITDPAQHTLTVDHLAPGVYHLRVEGADGVSVLPFVRQ